MSTKARKARKRAGVKFEKANAGAAKVGTPVEERSVPLVLKKRDGAFGYFPSNRALRKVADRVKLLASFEPKRPAPKKRLLSRKGGK